MIVDEKKQAEYASKFTKDGDASYIHIESHKNQGTRIVVAGEIMSIMLSINLLINTMSEKTGTTFLECMDWIQDIQFAMKKNKYSPLANEKTIINGEIADNETTKFKDQVKDLEKNIAIVEREKKNMEMKLKMSLEIKERQLEEERKKVKELAGQVLDLDHENERLSKLLEAR